MDKVIFLDVEGVLNNGTWSIEMNEQGVRVYRPAGSPSFSLPSFEQTDNPFEQTEGSTAQLREKQP